MGLFSRGNGDKLSEQLVLQALGTVQEPELGGDLVSRKMIKDVQITALHYRAIRIKLIIKWAERKGVGTIRKGDGI